jgi:hypothetical protein
MAIKSVGPDDSSVGAQLSFRLQPVHLVQENIATGFIAMSQEMAQIHQAPPGNVSRLIDYAGEPTAGTGIPAESMLIMLQESFSLYR